MNEIHDDGLYFGLDEETYHAEPRLSSSLMKWLRVSPADFWVRSWLNPDRVEDEDSGARLIGKAYHRRILEGREAFLRDYAAMLDRADYPEAIAGNDALREACKERGLKTGGSKAVLIERLTADDKGVQIWERLIEDHIAKHERRTLLAPDIMHSIEIAAAMIEKHPELSKCITGGHPEISIFWTDERDVKCKARIDYLKAQAIIDLKSFSNPLNKPLDVAVRSAIANNGYFIQAAMYCRAVEKAIEFAKDGQINGTVTDAFIKALTSADSDNRQFVFLFQDTGPAKVARGYVFPRGTVYGIGDTIVRESLETFAECHKHFGDGPWVDNAPITAFDDVQFPAWIGQN